ncbi:putative lipase esterase from carbohydrate esterase family ce10 [Moniliophthora roreri MCA 2997]|uniref:Lipase esterase from carbohydrate esterase family ce10 n=1 Tax=Moniliophthora roreri (strain MCA 2997) TaxID=1381753 RepID=V2XDK3_MONRO|nr:putative lipase esterase from carbohydrate esterase family ce10 [Moniliophthora roreri MCA 2997]
MPVNALTRKVGLRVGPVVLETLVKHYFDRIRKDYQQKEHGDDSKDGKSVQLRQDELLYDEAFNVIKTFLEAASHHTVEEMQEFSNYRTISPPWVHVVRLVVPVSCCDEAARYLITALGGEDVARRVVGGVKWWQVRGINGVDAQWITAKKDWQEAKRRYKMQDKSAAKENLQRSEDSNTYDKDMDEMRCILYSHGGGYYFGSVDQERYSIQRYARKINGRVFAINYRLAPQYPFPCALHDLLASYLYLIRPPPEAKHRPVKPAHIVVAGDSAGGGLSLALLQVIRDSGLPMPAGGVLISPWCDLTHSFPSVHTNTDTDVIPQYGLSLVKPSTLWPPPSDDMTNRVHNGLRSRIRQTFKLDFHGQDPTATMMSFTNSTPITPVDVGATTPLPQPDSNFFDKQEVSMTAQNGDILTVDQQVQLYTVNSLLSHPLVSPALSYLGGLPPLFFIASDKEVLRDEIIYTAHKAAYPDKYPVKDEVRAIYPKLNGIEQRYGPTAVHLQVYDDTAHVLPVLFSFTTPGKFCYRAIASFCKYVTGMMNPPPTSPTTDSLANSVSTNPPASPIRSELSKSSLMPPESSNRLSRRLSGSSKTTSRKSSVDSDASPTKAPTSSNPLSKPKSQSNLHRSVSESVKKTLLRSQKRSKSAPRLREGDVSESKDQVPPLPESSTMPTFLVAPATADSSSDIARPKGEGITASPPSTIHEVRFAGDPIVYSETPDFPSMKTIMIRERVSTRGVIRSLEPESELDACQVPHELIGALSELAIRRYIEGRKKFDTKYASNIRAIEKHRRRHLERAKKDTIKNMSVLQHSLEKEEQQKRGDDNAQSTIRDGLLSSSGWAWSWALDSDEHPPPSSIVSRRDTSEALELARIADQAVLQEDGGVLNGNNLWNVISNVLTEKGKRGASSREVVQEKPDPKKVDEGSEKQKTPQRKRSIFSQFASPTRT